MAVSAADSGEDAEIKELRGMLSSARTIRSDITAAKYQRWVVQEENHALADDTRDEENEWRRQRDAQRQKHREKGHSYMLDSREQLKKDKIVAEQVRQQNQALGVQMKTELTSLREAGAAEKVAWSEHGRSLAQAGAEQRERIRNIRGEGSKTLAEKTALIKREEAEYEAQLARTRSQLLQDNRAEVAIVKMQTSDEVTNQSKLYSYSLRKNMADDTRKAETEWKTEKEKKSAKFLASAHANKDEAKSTRAKAKQIREEVVQDRQRQAKAMREQMASFSAYAQKANSEGAASSKSVHDAIYAKKFVAPDDASRVQQQLEATKRPLW